MSTSRYKISSVNILIYSKSYLKEKYDFLSYQTKNELKNKSKDELHKILNEFNNFSYKKFSSLKNSNIDSTTVKAVMFATIDELYLINESIRKRDYLENKNLYFPHSLPHLFLFYQIFPHLTSVCGRIIRRAKKHPKERNPLGVLGIGMNCY